MPEVPPYPGTPRWVRVSGIIAIVLVLFVLLVILAGGGAHGPGRHQPSTDVGGHIRWGLLTVLGVLLVAGVAFNWNWLCAIGGVLPRHGTPDAIRRWTGWPAISRGWPSMTMTPGLRNFALTAHVATSVGLLGSVAVFLALAIAGMNSQDDQMVRAAYIANGFIAWFIIVPLVFAALVTGLFQSLGTGWGLFRHYWILAKLLLTVLTIVVLLLQMDGISYLAGVAAEKTLSSADLLGLRRSLRLHAAGGLLVLLLTTTLSVYKPRGLTRYGWRKQH